ncbi:hypothetical protein NDN01_24500 [Sphingomonas sp. QA11]|uniref:hypothetical protein n=1 Tax=Sphingomonas sp. QA11 TaxID=2950605 RepID=UPI00234B62D1|nr:MULTISPECIES: hypothetical protein [unclassified Sphingomonas]WCM27103.1 hypothetical protein NDN01_24500 [Sphingomonas sp. QA11]WEJ98345.1 MAG: hypothetical protein P0Y59_15485 [Sphingomonas sp.]
MTEQLDTTGMMLGEMKGQLREVIHNLNMMSTKLDALGERVISAADLPVKVKELEKRVLALEADRHRRDGAMSFGGWVVRSPLVGWLAGAGLALWMLLKGKP